MHVQYLLDKDDFVACRSHIEEELKIENAQDRFRLFRMMLLGAPFGFAVAWLNQIGPADAWRDWMLLGSVGLYFVSVIAARLWFRGAHARDWFGNFAGAYTLTLAPGGMDVQGMGRSGFYSWRHVLALDESDRHWLIHVRRDVAIPIPKAAMTEEQATTFFHALQDYWACHAENKGLTLGSRPYAFSPLERFRRALGDNVQAGVRLACWRPVVADDFRVGNSQLFWLFLLEFAGSLAYGYAQSLPNPAFNIYGMTEFGANVLVFILSGVVLATMVASRSSIPRLLVMLQSGLLVVTVLAWLTVALSTQIEHESPVWLAWGIPLVFIVWTLFVVFRAVSMLYLQPPPIAWVMVGVFAIMDLGATSYFPQMQLFHPNNEADWEARQKMKLDVEKTFYRQAGLVEQALSGLKAQRPGAVDLYFVGFAGQAEEKVFSNDVRFARRLVEQRFDMGGRSLALINNHDAVADTPLANAHNLEAVLKGVALRMDVDEDVLFLFLTSHGAKDHTLSVSFWPLELNDLKAEELKSMLDASGIRNRVIVVSACYSGGFLDVLKDDDSLILTASSRDKVSYGCGDGTKFTYFSEAYFVKSLARGATFTNAFEEARSQVAAREKDEGRQHSDPQIFVGRNILNKLKALENIVTTQAWLDK